MPADFAFRFIFRTNVKYIFKPEKLHEITIKHIIYNSESAFASENQEQVEIRFTSPFRALEVNKLLISGCKRDILRLVLWEDDSPH